MSKWVVIVWDEYKPEVYVYNKYKDAKEQFELIVGYSTKNTYLTVVTEEQEYSSLTETN